MMPETITSLELQNPSAFWLLVLIPVWLWWYRNQQAQFWETAFRHTPLAVVEHLKQAPTGLRRFLFPLWVVVLQLLFVIALSRPVMTGSIPTLQVNLMLVMDISLSMLADDIEPDRLDAAKAAAIRFINSLPDDVRVGLELFAGNNYVVEQPTRDHEAVTAYIDTLSERHLQMRTEIGSALKTAVEVLSLGKTGSAENDPAEGDGTGKQKPKQVVVLMSDGDSQEGYPWSAAVAMAREENIAIYTIGVGSTGEASIVYQGRRVPVSFNENILRQIATVSGGQFFRVANADEFQKVYEQVKQQAVVMEHHQEEITWLPVLLALLTFLAGMPIIRKRF
jgi:Ca-activated chloride channel family protein